MCFCCYSSSPALELTIIASGFSEHFKVGIASVTSAFILENVRHWKNHACLLHSFKFPIAFGYRHLSSFAQASEISLRCFVSSDATSKIPLLRWAYCNLVCSLSPAAIFLFCFLDCVGQSSGQIVPCRGVAPIVKTTPQKTRFAMWNMQEFGIQIEWTITATRTPLTTRSTISTRSTTRNPTMCAATWNTWGTRERVRSCCSLRGQSLFLLLSHSSLTHRTLAQDVCVCTSLHPMVITNAWVERSLWLPWPFHQLHFPPLLHLPWG